MGFDVHRAMPIGRYAQGDALCWMCRPVGAGLGWNA